MVEAVNETGTPMGVCDIDEKEPSTTNEKTSRVSQEVVLAKPQDIPFTRDITYASTTETGSMLTTAEESGNLAKDSAVSAAIQSSSTQYDTALEKYRSGSISFTELQKEYSTIFSSLLTTVKELISKDTTGKISPIQTDYDDQHQEEYSAHLQVLIGHAQDILKIPAYQCLLPPSPNYTNLLKNGDFSGGTTDWALTAGQATLKVNTPDTYDKTSPVENKSSLSFTDMPPKPGYATVSQSVTTTPGHTYLVSGYVIGTPPAKEGDAFSGGISLSGAKSITSSITGKTTHFPQISNEIYNPGIQRCYYWVEATESEMTVNLYGGSQTVFKNISVIDIGEGNPFQIAQDLVPPPVTTGYPQVGHYPQVEQKLQQGDNLVDGAISIQKNVDQTQLNNSGHPYWFIDSHIVANKGTKITNAQNGNHGLYLPKDATATTNGPVPCPSGSYTFSLNVFIPESSAGKMTVQFSGTSLVDNVQIGKISKEYDSLTPGQVNGITFNVDPSFFAQLPTGTFFRPSVTIANNGEPITVFGAKLTSPDTTTYDQINRINPYNPDSSWYQSGGFSKTYNFKQGSVDRDWGVALTGNTMFSPGTPSTDYTKLTANGIELTSKHDHTISPPYSNGGIQSTQFVPSGKDFSISMQFTATTSTADYEPTLALWTYGESQRGLDHPLTHTNGPGADPITEFDCEMGSDSAPKTPPPSGTVYARDGSYIGHAEGGHAEYLDTNPDGTPNWKAVPDFWDGKEHTLTMEGSYNPQGHLILTRLLDGKQFSHQDIGTGPFSPMYIKIALENPDWNSRGKTDGTAKVTIQNVSVSIQPPKGLSEGVTIPTVSTSDIDYAWFTPGGGGAPSYTPFPNSSPPPSFHTPTSIQDLEKELDQWEKQDPTAKTFAADVLSLVQKYSSGGSPLVPIEAWVFTVITDISDNASLSTAYSSLTASQKTDFNTLSGYSDFTVKTSSHSYDKPTVTAIAESFSNGTFGLHNPNDKSIMSYFYQNLHAGQDLKIAAQNAYQKVPSNTLSQPMNTLIQDLSSYTPHFTPHNPTSVQDLESELTEIQSSTPDRNLKALAAVIIDEVKILADLPLTAIEAWIYISVIGELTNDSKYAVGFHNITPSEQETFKTLSGIDHIQSALAAHSFSVAEVTAIAKMLSDGTITLKNSNDTAFMKAFDSNLSQGQDPKTAAQNAYTKYYSLRARDF